MKFLTVSIVAILGLMFLGIATVRTADSTTNPITTYQGKTVMWWAKHTVKARKDANARSAVIQHLKAKIAQTRKDADVRAVTIHHLKLVMAHNPTIEECVRLATIAYPSFTEARAWQIIYHESWTSGRQFAKNRHSTASGLYQFLTSTFASTPYGRAGMSIWSPCASSLAAGWMHQNGRGGEWAIG